MGLSAFNITELGVFSASVLGAIAMLLKQIQNSKCKNCSICWGACKCDRVVPPDIEEVGIEVVSSSNPTTQS